MTSLPTARPHRSGRYFCPERATVRVLRGGGDEAHEVALGRTGIHRFEMVASGLDLKAGERITVELAFPALRRRIVAEARVTDLIEGRDGSTRYRCRFVRIAPWGVRALLSLASADAPTRRAC